MAGSKPALPPDLEDLPGLFFGVRGRGDDEQPVQEVNGDAVRTLIVCATNSVGKRTKIKTKKVFMGGKKKKIKDYKTTSKF